MVVPHWSSSEIPNPKRSPRDAVGRNGWYPFYAGFSPSFATWALSQLGDCNSKVLLDPWNGSGTTTSIAAQTGVSAVGVDLNPAMVVVAKARLLSPLDVPSIRPLAKQIRKTALRLHEENGPSESLNTLFAHEGASALRAFENATRNLLAETPSDSTTTSNLDYMSPLAAFFLVAIFKTARKLLHPLAGTNPVWTKLNIPGRSRPRPNKERVSQVFTEEVARMLATEVPGRPLAIAGQPNVRVAVGSSTALPVLSSSVDLVLSSPPYCTRVDYAVATLPELLILGLVRGKTFDDLRRKLIGTTTVPELCDNIDSNWGPTCVAFLEAVKKHTSKASESYYLKSHARYFQDLFASIEELRRVMAPGGTAVLVVQDSHYKEIHNDLPTITIEMALKAGLKHIGGRHFPLRRLIAQTNPRVRHYRQQEIKAVESVLVFRN